jgi:hypothetical protein
MVQYRMTSLDENGSVSIEEEIVSSENEIDGLK